MNDTQETEKREQGLALSEDEEVIDLTDVAADSSEDEDPIIDLTDVAADSSVSEEPIIESTEVIESVSFEVDEEEAENIIELTNAAQEDTLEDIQDILESPEEEVGKFGDLIVEDVHEDSASEIDDGFSDSLGVDLESGLTAAPSITEEQLEQAVERVVREMFSDKIEPLLIKVIEREVGKEIERLKNLLLDGAMDDNTY